MGRTARRASLVFGYVLAAAGCGGQTHAAPDLTDAEVVVTLNGQPLANALVTLTPTDTKYGGSAVASGVTDAAGRAKLACGTKPGACVGGNKVTVSEGPAPAEARNDDSDLAQKAGIQYQAGLKNRPIPARYASVVQSALDLDVQKGKTEYKLDLTR